MWTLQTYLRRMIWLCMAPLLALALVSLSDKLWQAQTLLSLELDREAHQTQQHLDLMLRFQAQGLGMLAGSVHLEEPGGAAEFYREAQAFHQHFGDHVVLAHMGRMLMNTRVPLGAALPALPKVDGRSAVSEALASGKAAVGDLFDGPITTTKLLAMAVPVATPSADGRVLLATMEAPRIERALSELPLPPGIHLLLLDSRGRPIAARGGLNPDAVPALFGKRIVRPLHVAPWSLIVETDGATQRAAFLRDTALWLTALLLAAGVAYLAALRAGEKLQSDIGSLTSAGSRPLAWGLVAEIAQVRERLLQLGRERDEKEAALMAREAQAWQLLRVIPEPIVVTLDGVIEFANQSVGDLLGRDLKHVVGQRGTDLLHPEDKPQAEAQRAALPPLIGATTHAQARVVRSDGSTRDLRLTIVRIEMAGGARTISVGHDVTLQNAAQKELEQSRSELRDLLGRLARSQELERKRIALDIHDDLQQTLAVIKLAASALCDADRAGQEDLSREMAQSIDREAARALQSTRRIVDDLRPQLLDDLGLRAALDELLARFGRDTGLRVGFEALLPDGDETLDPTLSVMLYRVAQEALNNVRKHAHASSVQLRLQRRPDGRVELRVRDDGCGLPQPAASPAPLDAANRQPHPSGGAWSSGLGLAGMRERMQSVGGSLQLRSQAGVGTEVLASAPGG